MSTAPVTIPSEPAAPPPKPSALAVMCEKRWHVFLYIIGFAAAFIALATVATIQINQYGTSATKASIKDSNWAKSLVAWDAQYDGINYPETYTPKAKETNATLALQVELTLGNVVPASSGGTVDCRIHFELSNAYVTAGSVPLRPAYTFSLSVDGQKYTVSPTAQTVDWKTTLSFESGNLLSFPFDRYIKTIPVLVSVADGSGTDLKPAFWLKVDKADSGFFSTSETGITFKNYSITTDPEDDSVDYQAPSVSMTFRRPPFFRLYPMCLFIIFWIIMICEVLFIVPYLIGSAKSSFSNPAFYTGLLFAVPGMRNALPGGPPIGSLADYYSFFWVIFLTVLLLLVSMHHFYMDNRKEQRPSGIPGETVLVGTWIAKNKKDPLPYRANGMLDIPALIKFWKSTNAAEELF